MAPRDGEKDIRDQLLALLLERIEEDTYPSSMMMDMAESLMHPSEVPHYAEILLSKMRGGMVPSTDLLHRVRSLA